MRSRLSPRLVVVVGLLGLFQAAVYGQSLVGGPVVGTGGVFDFERDSSDFILEMGGLLDYSWRESWSLAASLGFIANVSDNDAFDDRSVLASAGLQHLWSHSGSFSPFLGGGYGFTNGELTSNHFAYLGGGMRRWYGENIGWQFEVRDYLNADHNLLQIRLAVVLR